FEHVAATIFCRNRRGLEAVVIREIALLVEAAELLQRFDDLRRDLTAIERVATVLRNLPQRGGERRIGHVLARLRRPAVGEEIGGGGGVFIKPVSIRDPVELDPRSDAVAVFRSRYSRRQDMVEADRAVA